MRYNFNMFTHENKWEKQENLQKVKKKKKRQHTEVTHLYEIKINK